MLLDELEQPAVATVLLAPGRTLAATAEDREAVQAEQDVDEEQPVVGARELGAKHVDRRFEPSRVLGEPV